MDREQRSGRGTETLQRYEGYTVYDRDGDKIGKVDDLFVDEHDQPEYIGVKMGFLGTRSTLIPWEIATVDENDRRIEVSVDKAQAKEGPSFDDDEEITPDYEERVYSHYGLQRAHTGGERGEYGDYYGDEQRGRVEHDRDRRDDDELRVQRSEEELRAGTREREAGALDVRKRVRTDREQVRVPTRHEEVSVERVPVNEEGTGAEIGDDEISVPVVEEEVDVDDQTTTRGRGRSADLDDQSGHRGK